MKRPSVWVTAVACYAASVATCLGATGLAATASLPKSFTSDRKGAVMVCNGGLAMGWSLARVLRGRQ